MDAQTKTPEWEAAMEASYALEGVKDQATINMLVASKLLGDRGTYQQYRTFLMERLSSTQLAILDAYHNANTIDVRMRAGYQHTIPLGNGTVVAVTCYIENGRLVGRFHDVAHGLPVQRIPATVDKKRGV